MSSKNCYFVEEGSTGRSLHYVLCEADSEANNGRKEDKND